PQPRRLPLPPRSPPFPYPTLFRSGVPASPHSLSLHVTNVGTRTLQGLARGSNRTRVGFEYTIPIPLRRHARRGSERGAMESVEPDRKSTRLNSSHDQISYAVFCLK